MTVVHACRAVGIGRQTAYDERRRSEEFAAAWDEVEEWTTERLEREAFRRAFEGTEKPVFQGGAEVGRVREFSDTLMIFLLKGRRPGTYRERVEHTGAGGGPIEHRARLDLSKLTDEQLAALEAIQPDAGADSR